MRTRTAAVGAALLITALTSCGTDTDAEVQKSTTDIRTSVQHLRDAITDENTAVKAKSDDARTEVENVRLVAQVEAKNLGKYANRAPAKTQDFADAAETWANSIATARTAILDKADTSTSTVAIAVSIRAERQMDQEAAALHVTPWTPRPAADDE
ncbi:hypothetical protein ACIGZH_01705 [Streptomyces sp. NPDC058319]|uniref:hypothetical protein n=1 Tax=unclassified Streptomyces TaxID=2593676 RepID=UPI0036E5C7DB